MKGFRGLGFRVQGSGFRVQGSGFRVWATTHNTTHNTQQQQHTTPENWPECCKMPNIGPHLASTVARRSCCTNWDILEGHRKFLHNVWFGQTWFGQTWIWPNLVWPNLVIAKQSMAVKEHLQLFTVIKRSDVKRKSGDRGHLFSDFMTSSLQSRIIPNK